MSWYWLKKLVNVQITDIWLASLHVLVMGRPTIFGFCKYSKVHYVFVKTPVHVEFSWTLHNGVCDMPFAMPLLKKFQASSQQAEIIPQDLSYTANHKYSLGAVWKWGWVIVNCKSACKTQGQKTPNPSQNGWNALYIQFDNYNLNSLIGYEVDVYFQLPNRK